MRGAGDIQREKASGMRRDAEEGRSGTARRGEERRGEGREVGSKKEVSRMR